MSTIATKVVLCANASYLLAASTGGFIADVLGAFYAIGPQGKVLAHAPYAGIGFIEAHGLAFIFGVLLWRAEPTRLWHLTAAAIHVLLGSANLAFWQIFVAGDMLALGYVTTILHWVFVALQLIAAGAASSGRRAPAFPSVIATSRAG
jgi:hypothetical protein